MHVYNLWLTTAACLTLAQRFSAHDYAGEIDRLYRVGPRLTGSPTHLAFMSGVEERLRCMGADVRVDEYPFEYQDPPTRARLEVCGRGVRIAATYPYSGSAANATAPLVLLRGPKPAWESARGKIAVVPVPNALLPVSSVLGVWNASQAWAPLRNPALAAPLVGDGLVNASAAGVVGVVFAWEEDISDGNAEAQYLPFKNPRLDVPAVWTSGEASRQIMDAADKGQQAALSLPQPLSKGATRTIWTVVRGNYRANETVLVLTHTDGTNPVEENGHIALYQMLQDALDARPNRTLVFVFLGAHLRIPALTNAKNGRAMTRWLDDHPDYARSAVAGITVEHLGAVQFAEDAAENTYYPTGRTEPEILYANTQVLASLLFQEWKGADEETRVSNPVGAQIGEGQALTALDIPNIALATSPVYLLKEIWGRDVEVVDMNALERQVQSFRVVQRRLDEMSQFR